jgi:hypothetical protein
MLTLLLHFLTLKTLFLLPLVGMALVKFGGGITGMSGSIAGSTFARNRFGNYIRPRTKPVNPKSTTQHTIRGCMAYLADLWHSTLVAGERTAWSTYAAAVTVKNRLGETVYLTGFNMFIRSNSVRKYVGLNVVAAGPTTLSLPETDPTFIITASAASQKITVGYDKNLPWSQEVGGRMHVFQGQPQLATRNYFNGPWKIAGNLPDHDDGSVELNAPYTLVAGQKIWCYARIDRIDGRLSNPFVAACTVAA